LKSFAGVSNEALCIRWQLLQRTTLWRTTRIGSFNGNNNDVPTAPTPYSRRPLHRRLRLQRINLTSERQRINAATMMCFWHLSQRMQPLH
jgi:hypothetical protein